MKPGEWFSPFMYTVTSHGLVGSWKVAVIEKGLLVELDVREECQEEHQNVDDFVEGILLHVFSFLQGKERGLLSTFFLFKIDYKAILRICQVLGEAQPGAQDFFGRIYKFCWIISKFWGKFVEIIA